MLRCVGSKTGWFGWLLLGWTRCFSIVSHRIGLMPMIHMRARCHSRESNRFGWNSARVRCENRYRRKMCVPICTNVRKRPKLTDRTHWPMAILAFRLTNMKYCTPFCFVCWCVLCEWYISSPVAIEWCCVDCERCACLLAGWLAFLHLCDRIRALRISHLGCALFHTTKLNTRGGNGQTDSDFIRTHTRRRQPKCPASRLGLLPLFGVQSRQS